MKMLIGLGNPGNYYERTRHNVGFLLIDKFSKKLNLSIDKRYSNEGSNILYCKYKDIIFLKPQDYINNSGICISKFLKIWNISIDDILVVYDDINLLTGKIRFRRSGSDGGHNGMKNILEILKTDKIKRLRIGIGYNKKSNKTIKEWVLEKISDFELNEILKNEEKIFEGINKWIFSNNDEKNIDKIMNKFNSNSLL